MRKCYALEYDFLPLPDARNRLLLDDRYRVELFARRFNDYQCVVFDEQTIMDRRNGAWWTGESTLKMGRHGRLVDVTIEVAT